MGKLIEDIKSKLSAEAQKEFSVAVEGMTLLNNVSGEYVNKAKAESELSAVVKDRDALKDQFEKIKADIATGGQTVEALQAELVESEKAYKAELETMKASAARDQKTAQVKTALAQAKIHDADLGFTAMKLELEKLEHDEKGNLIGISDRIKMLQEVSPFLFDVQKSKNTYVPSRETAASTSEAAKSAVAGLYGEKGV